MMLSWLSCIYCNFWQNVDFLISQGNAAIYLKYGRKCYTVFIVNFMLFLAEKK